MVVEIEYVVWVGFVVWWMVQQQGYLVISYGLFGQVVVDDQGVFIVIVEVFVYGVIGVWCQVLQGGGFGSVGGDYDGVGQGIVFFQFVYDVGDSGLFLVDGYVDVFNIVVFLVDDGVDCEGGFVDLVVVDDQFVLVMVYWDYGVD